MHMHQSVKLLLLTGLIGFRFVMHGCSRGAKQAKKRCCGFQDMSPLSRLLKERAGASALVRFERALMLAKFLGDKCQERRATRGLAAAARLQVCCMIISFIWRGIIESHCNIPSGTMRVSLALPLKRLFFNSGLLDIA